MCRAQVAISSQPQNAVVPAGTTATFSVTANGPQPLAFQWRRNGAPIPGATRSTLMLTEASQGDADYYDVAISSAGTSLLSNSARLLVTPESYPTRLTVDVGKSIRLETTDVGALSSQAVLPDGRYYLSGTFVSFDGSPVRHIVRINLNGTRDLTFVAPEFDGNVLGLALQPDGLLLAIGTFTRANGEAAGGIVRLLPDGSIDRTFSVGTGFLRGINQFFVAPGGSIFALQGLGPFQGMGDYNYIARLTPTGSIDPAFSEPTFTRAGGAGFPLKFAVSPDGSLYVAGDFDQVNGVPRNRLVRILPNGSIDPAFNPGIGPDGRIQAMIVTADGKLVLGGEFVSYQGTPARYIARINPDGRLDPTFVTGFGFSNVVTFLARLPGESLLVSSIGSSYNGSSISGPVRLSGSGVLDASFRFEPPSFLSAIGNFFNGQILATGHARDGSGRAIVSLLNSNGQASGVSSPPLRYPGEVQLLAHLPRGKILAAGNFTHVNGVPARHVARFNPDFTLDRSFVANGFPTIVRQGVVLPDSRIVLIHDNAISRLNADGSRDTSFAVGGQAANFSNCHPVVLPDGNVFVQTRSPTWAGTAVTNGFVILGPNGQRLLGHSFLPGPPAGSFISNVTALPHRQLLVTGTFKSWNGVSRTNVVRLNANGSVDPTFNLDVRVFPGADYIHPAENNPVYQRDGRLLFNSGDEPHNLYRFTAEGVLDSSFTASLPRLFSGGQFFIQPDDRIVLSSEIYSNGQRSPFLARLTREGARDSSFDVRGSNSWTQMLVADNGELVTSDGSGYLHRYASIPLPTIATQPVAQTVLAGTALSLSVNATGLPPLTYQWYRNGAALVGATDATLRYDLAPANGSGSYTVAVNSAGGSVTSNSVLVTVNPRALAGAYFGVLNSGGADAFALHVRENGTGVFLGYHDSTRSTLVATNVQVSPDRQFTFTAVDRDLTGTERLRPGSGQVHPDGAVTGTIPSLNRNFTALTPTLIPGPGTPYTGFYQGSAIGNASQCYLVVGSAPSSAFLLYTRTEDGAAGRGTIEADGRVTVVTNRNVRATATVQTAPLFSALLTFPAGAPLAFFGANDDLRADNEKFANLSSRGRVGAAAGSLTAGFYVAGDRPKPVLVRAAGPSLAAFGVSDALPAARLEIFRGSTSLAVGQDWSTAPNATAIAQAATRVGAFALPAGSRDAALLLALEPGAYSAVVTGPGGASGVALVEVYDAAETGASRMLRLANLSTLAPTGAGEGALAAGFVVSGAVPKRVLIRGAGPALAAFGVGTPLSRPDLSLYSGATLLTRNSNWSTTPDAPAIARTATQVGAFAFPANSADAAILINLAPGAYSAEVSGVGGATGTALVEIYELP